MGFSGGSVVAGKESICQRKRSRKREFNHSVRKIPWRRKWQPTPIFLLGKSHGQRNLAGYSHGVAKRQIWLCTHAPRVDVWHKKVRTVFKVDEPPYDPATQGGCSRCFLYIPCSTCICLTCTYAHHSSNYKPACPQLVIVLTFTSEHLHLLATQRSSKGHALLLVSLATNEPPDTNASVSGNLLSPGTVKCRRVLPTSHTPSGVAPEM